LGGVVAMLHALEQVCTSSSLMPLLVNGFSALGDEDSGNFFVDFIRHMNGDQRPNAQRALARPPATPPKGIRLPRK
jgi:hypothetical protein